MYALIEFAGKQFRIEEGSSIKVPYVDGKVGTKVTIDKVLYLDDGKNKTVGTPLVSDVKIDGEITSHGRERKVVVFKFKRRKGYQKKNTHRQEYSMLKVGKLKKVKKSPSKKSETKATETKIAPKKAAPKKAATKKTTVKKKKPVVKKASPAQPKETKE
jgi:large subunit ribosomal protein L21